VPIRVSPDTLSASRGLGGGTGFSLANGLGSGSADLFPAGAYARQNIGAASTGRTLVYDVTTSRAVAKAGKMLAMLPLK
jgi:hypothetical protein